MIGKKSNVIDINLNINCGGSCGKETGTSPAPAPVPKPDTDGGEEKYRISLVTYNTIISDSGEEDKEKVKILKVETFELDFKEPLKPLILNEKNIRGFLSDGSQMGNFVLSDDERLKEAKLIKQYSVQEGDIDIIFEDSWDIYTEKLPNEKEMFDIKNIRRNVSKVEKKGIKILFIMTDNLLETLDFEINVLSLKNNIKFLCLERIIKIE